MPQVNVTIEGIVLYCDDSLDGMPLGNGYSIQKQYFDDLPFKERIVDGRNRLSINYLGSKQQDDSGRIYFLCLHKEDVLKCKDLIILSESAEAGVTIIKSKDNREIFMTGHLEYDTMTLAQEYFRDIDKGMKVPLPKNYFPNDDPTQRPHLQWRSHSNNLYSNWLNYYVYQVTPYDLS